MMEKSGYFKRFVLVMRPAIERVRNGARHLDALVPNWRERVDVNRLDQASDASDVVSQVAGLKYLELDSRRKPDACDRLGVTVENEAAFGFAVGLYTCHSVAEYKQAYIELTDAWKVVLTEGPTRFKEKVAVG